MTTHVVDQCEQPVVRERTVSTAQRVATLVAVIVPFIGLIVAITGLWGWGFTWVEAISFLVMYIATGLGISVGFHRLFTHRSFECVRPVRWLLAVMGCMAVQGPLLRWVATHRRHHQHSDQPEDPHSPHCHDSRAFGVLSGWWHAHIGWMFEPDRVDLARYVGDLQKDNLVRRASEMFAYWIGLGLLIPTVFGGLVTGTWTGALLGFLWGGLVRTFFTHHVTWSINSVCHLWGRKTFESRDESRNNAICGLLGFGEGWHNNHHAFPSSPRYGMRWWEIDFGYLFIRTLTTFGLAWRLQLPNDATISSKRIESATVAAPAAPAAPVMREKVEV